MNCKTSPEWRCKEGCGECCGLIPFDLGWWKEHESRAVEVGEVKAFDDKIVATRPDSDPSCVFLTAERKCAVYEDRPEVPCKIYGRTPKLLCPHITVEGKPRTPQDKRRVQAKIDAEVDTFMEQAGKMLGIEVRL